MGSDAHKPEDIGADFAVAYELMKELGFADVTRFQNRMVRK